MAERDPWIESFRKSLHEHEEPYQLGAWERFERHRAGRRRQRVWRRALSVAAILLLGVGLYWMATPSQEMPRDLAQQRDPLQPRPEMNDSPEQTIPSERNALPDEAVAQARDKEAAQPDVLEQNREILLSESATARPEEMTRSDRQVAVSGIPESSTEEERPSASESVSSRVSSSVTGRTLGAWTLAGEPSRSITGRERAGMQRFSDVKQGPWVRDANAGDLRTTNSEPQPTVRASDLRSRAMDRAFAWGVAYAPVMNIQGGTAQLSMGAGVHARMELRNGWGLGSALVLSRNRFQTDADVSTMTMFQTTALADGGPTVLDSRMEADLVSLELPLNLRYEVNDVLTLSGGFSTLAYLQETYTYRVDYRQPYFSVLRSEEGVQFESGERERTEELREEEAPMSGLHLGAFYNMGAEFSWLISNRHWVSVEPFFKIPTGDIARQDLTYSSGGVQLKLYF